MRRSVFSFWAVSGGGLPTSLKPLFSVLWLGQVSGSTLVDESGNENNLTITGKDFTTSYIPSTSTATFSLADLAPLKVDDDWDGLFFTDAGAIKQVTVTELNNNDYVRTLVKYSDEAPHDIQWIGVLDDAANPTTEEWDLLHQYFRLGLYWSGSLNTNGVLKDNRPAVGLGYKGWIAEAEALTLTLPPLATRKSVNKYALEVRNYGLDTRIDRAYMLMLNDASSVDGAGLVPLFGDRSKLLLLPTAITKTTRGLEANGIDQYVNLNFTPSIDGVNYTQNSASFSTYQYKVRIKEGSILLSTATGSALLIRGSSTATGNTRLNTASNLTGSITYNNIEYIAIDRNAASGPESMRVIRNVTVNSYDVASTVLPTASAYLFKSSTEWGDQGVSNPTFGGSFTNAEHVQLKDAIINHKTRLGL